MSNLQMYVVSSFFCLFFLIFIWLHRVLRRSTQDPYLLHAGSQLPDQGLNLDTLHWEGRVLTTRLPEKSCGQFSEPLRYTSVYSQVLYSVALIRVHWDSYAMLCYAKSLQSCLTLCDPIDGSPPGSIVPGILQARILERVAISFSSA